jgi:PleD family two-component response regulator
MSNPNWILLVDPSKNLLNAYRMILEAEKYGVDTASSLEDSYHQFASREYPIVIIEYFPPYDDTCEIIRWMKEKRPETYILMVTNVTIDEVDYGKLFGLGLDDLILKPYSPEKILVHLQKGLRQREMILKNQELEKQNVFDPCSPKVQKSIFNHMFFQRILRQEVKRAKRHVHPLSIVLVKLPPEEKKDPFDSFCNEMARILRSYIREEDIVGRESGGFEILLPETGQAGSRALLQRISSLIESYPPFRDDDALKPFLQTLSLQAFTYPEILGLPKSLRLVLEDIDRDTSRK